MTTFYTDDDHPLIIESGQGMKVKDIEGKEYMTAFLPFDLTYMVIVKKNWTKQLKKSSKKWPLHIVRHDKCSSNRARGKAHSNKS